MPWPVLEEHLELVLDIIMHGKHLCNGFLVNNQQFLQHSALTAVTVGRLFMLNMP